MAMLRAILRCLLVVPLLLAAVLDGQVRLWLGLMQPGPEGAVWVHRWCRRLARALGIVVEVTGPLPGGSADANQAGMLAVVSNHVSYLDVLLYSAARPFLMVSKTEVRGWPVIGWITAQAGTIYVQRADVKASLGEQSQTHAEVNAKMAAAYRSGLPVLFFPEGTTTDGSEVLAFRRGLYHSILADEVPMKVAAIRYELDGAAQGMSVAQDVAFVGDADFAPHFFNFLKLRGVRARMRFGAETVRGADRFALALNSHEMLVELFDELAPRRVAVETAEPAAMDEEAAAAAG
jgi:1-acyl-sn-glycerol-3-phosphate acyltransferase